MCTFSNKIPRIKCRKSKMAAFWNFTFAGVHYLECVSYARLRNGVVSQPFCADLSPTTFTSRSASDFDSDISTEDSSENENENTYTEASSDNSSSNPETESSAKSEVRRSSTMPNGQS